MENVYIKSGRERALKVGARSFYKKAVKNIYAQHIPNMYYIEQDKLLIDIYKSTCASLRHI